MIRMFKTAVLVVAIRVALGSANSHVGATTETKNKNNDNAATLQSSMRFSSLQHGKIKDRSYFAESSSAVKSKNFREKTDLAVLIDLSGTDVTIHQEMNTSGSPVISSVHLPINKGTGFFETKTNRTKFHTFYANFNAKYVHSLYENLIFVLILQKCAKGFSID